MRFAIIAAGEGSRLAHEGVPVPKPLVRLGGETMIDRLIRIFTRQGASEIVVIVNERREEVVSHMRQIQQERAASRCPLRLVVKNTPSSMHSFFEISPYLEGEPFCLTTVDTIFKETDFADYIHQFQTTDYDGMMAVTDFIDDEKPLYVGTDADMNITGFFDDDQGCRFISGGIYCLHPVALKTLRRCVAEGQSRMRNFQRALVADQLHLHACAFSKILDVDHSDDIPKAEAFLQS